MRYRHAHRRPERQCSVSWDDTVRHDGGSDTSMRILDRFVEAGGTLIDTANNYPFWNGTGDESETAIGKWLAKPGNRDRIVLSTQVRSPPLVPGTGLETAEGLSAKAIDSALEGSLRRLGTDHIDAYWTHIEDRSVPLAETVDAWRITSTPDVSGCWSEQSRDVAVRSRPRDRPAGRSSRL